MRKACLVTRHKLSTNKRQIIQYFGITYNAEKFFSVP